MIKRNDHHDQAKKKETRRRFGAYALFVVCTATLASGFFFAARQHFASMDYGMKNSRLRRQIDQLEAEKRRLILAREVSLSPAEIKKSAKKVGLLDPPATDNRMIASADPMDIKAASLDTRSDKHLVTRTVAVAATSTPQTAAFKKSEKPANASKNARSAE